MSKRRGGPTKRAEIAISEAWKSFYATPEGRQAIGELLLASGVYTPVLSNDATEIARLTGERNVALRIVQYIGLKPDAFPQMAVDDEDIIERMINPRH